MTGLKMIAGTYTYTKIDNYWNGCDEWHIHTSTGFAVVCKSQHTADIECEILRKRGFREQKS